VEDLVAARMQMAMSLGFHILFAVAGMAMPLLMVLAEGRYLRHGDPLDRELAKRWSKGVAILFAVGAVSGTALSFELGLLWPTFMAFAGPVFGLAFTLEGFAFFFEAIFLGVYLYGWDRVRPLVHWLAGVGVLISGSLSGMFVVTANAWMNNPTGFRIGPDGLPIDIEPLAAVLNPNALPAAFHMLTAAFAAMGFAVVGVHAFYLRREPGNRFHRKGLGIALIVGWLGALCQPLTGHVAGETIAHEQPIKLAAAEAHWETQAAAPFVVGGWPDEEAEETYGALEIPYLLSVLAHGDPHAEVQGLKETPPEDRPPVTVVHWAFDLMVACGLILIAVGSWACSCGGGPDRRRCNGRGSRPPCSRPPWACSPSKRAGRSPRWVGSHGSSTRSCGPPTP